MRHMKLKSNEDPAAVAQRFAIALHDGWGVGDSRCDNGIVLLLSQMDRQMYISTGAGATSLLTYDVLGEILDDVRPYLRKGRYDEAVERAVMDIGLALAGRPVEPDPDRPDGFGKDDAMALGIFTVAAGTMFFFAFRSDRRKRRRYNDCKSKLEKLKRDQAALRAGSYNPTSCPVCLEDFAPEPGTPTGGAAEGGSGSAAAAAAAAASASDAHGGDGGGSVAARDCGAAEAGQGCKGRGCGKHGCTEGPGCSGGGRAGGAGEVELRLPLLGSNGGGSGAATASGTGEGGSGAGGGAAAGTEGGAGAAAAPERRPLVLPCGHAFCEPCISKWLDQKKVTCPICRRPIDEDDAQAPSQDPSAPRQPPRPPSQRPGDAGGSGSGSGSAGPSRPPCTVDDDDDATAAAAAVAAAEAQAGGSSSSFLGGGGWGFGTGGRYGTSGPRLRLRWGGRRRGVRMQEDLLMAEMMFRLRQLQRQHPDFISSSMLSAWEQDLREGREFSSAQLRDFQLRDPASRSALAASGRSGTSVRFGGGGSGGGGGRGGSW